MRISECSSDVCSSDLGDQLTLIIQLRRDFRQNDGFAMANQAGIEPSEQRRKFRGGEPALGRVIRIVQTQANDLWCLAERWTKCDVVDVDFFTFRCGFRSEEHTSELQSLMRISYAVFCLKTKNKMTFK